MASLRLLPAWHRGKRQSIQVTAQTNNLMGGWVSDNEHLWSRADRRLAELKASETSQRLDKALSKSLIALSAACAERGDDPVSIARLSSFFTVVNRLVRIAYQKHKDVWEIQGNNESPEFVRTLYEFMIVPRIEIHLGSVRDALNKIPEDAVLITEGVRSLLELAELEAKKCKLEWKRKCEIEATEIEYNSSSRIPQPDAGPKSQIEGASMGPQSQRPGRKPDESVRRRREIVCKMMPSKKNFGDDKQLKNLLSKLDEKGVPLPNSQGAPRGWKPKNWVELLNQPASKETKRKVDLLIRDRYPKRKNA